MSDNTSPKTSSGSSVSQKIQRRLSRGKEKVTETDRLLLFVHVLYDNIKKISSPHAASVLRLQVLQKLGKSVETRDDHFDRFHSQFNDQQVIKTPA